MENNSTNFLIEPFFWRRLMRYYPPIRISFGCALILLLLLAVCPLSAQIGEANLSPKINLHRLADQYVIAQTAAQYKSTLESAGELDPLPASVSRVKAKLEMAMGQPLDLHVVKAEAFKIRTFPNGATVVGASLVEALASEETAFAWLLAREASHYRQDHPFLGFRRRTAIDATLQVALEKNRLDSPLLQIAYEASQERYAPEEEAAADRMGFLYAVKAGYDPLKLIEAPATITKAIQGYGVGQESTNLLRAYQVALQEGVAPEWIMQEHYAKEVKDERGTQPEFLIAHTPLMDIYTNRSPSQYKRGENRRIGVRAKAEGYLTILYSTSSGEVKTILPNEYDKKGELQTGKLLLIPSDEYVKNKTQPVDYRWEGGNELYVCFVVTRTPWTAHTLRSRIVPDEFARIILKELEATKADLIDLYALKVSLKR